MKHYPYGFIFSEDIQSNTPEYFSTINILNKYFYQFDKELNSKVIQKEDKFLIIHGQIIHIGINEEFTEQELLNKLYDNYFNNFQKFLDILDFLAGRFVIIIGSEQEVKIFPDATHSRSTYFIKNTFTAASHVNLLKDCFKLQKADLIKGMHNTLLQTPYEDVQSILSNHSLTLNRNEYNRFFPRANNKYISFSENEKFNLIEKFWKKQLDEVYKNSENNFLTLTGGGDSRTSLALIKKYIPNTKMITYAYTDGVDNSTPTGYTLSIDNTIVKQMVSELNLNHKFLYFDEEDKSLTNEEENAISKNSIAKHSAFFVAFLRNNFNTNNLTHIRANLLEIGQAYPFKSNYKSNTLDSALEWFLKRHKKFIANDADLNKAKNMFEEYRQITNFGENIYDYHILDIYYWEIQMGRWYPELLNTHDIVCNTITPYNHRALIDITLSFNYKQRKNRFFQYELINRNYSILNFFGLNNIKNIYEQQRELLYTENENKIFDNITTYSSDKNSTKVCSPIEDNTLNIPDTNLSIGSYSEVKLQFKKKEGILNLELKNNFSNNNIKNTVFYELYVNNEMKLYEDMSNWKLTNSISIAGLKKDDKISIRVVLVKNIDVNLLTANSIKLLVMSYSEISSKKGSKIKFIQASSPYSTF